MEKTFLIICAFQRSGTNALRYTLVQSPNCVDCNEIFNPRCSPSSTNYFVYKKSQVRKDICQVIPATSIAEPIEKYLKHITEVISKPIILLDIKYNSWHHFNTLWKSPKEDPSLVQYVRNEGLPVLHLCRKNVFNQACSMQLAAIREVWKIEASVERRHLPAVPLCPDVTLRYMRGILEHQELFRNHFKKHPRYLELQYEDIFEHNHLSSDALQQIEKLCGRKIDCNRKIPLQKIVDDMSKHIENFDELCANIRTHGYGHYLTDDT